MVPDPPPSASAVSGPGPRGPTGSTRPIFMARAIRGFADGFVSILLALYLKQLGFDALHIGAIVTGTLIGSAALTLYAGLRWHHHPARTVLLASCALMAITGTGFATVTRFWPLLAIAVVGTLNPSGGDVSLFLPTEQAALADLSEAGNRTRSFALYNLSGGMGAALGALASVLPKEIASWRHFDIATVDRAAFGVYVLCALGAALTYRTLPRAESRASKERPPPLQQSRSIVVRLSMLFSLDAAGGGFVVQALLVVYLAQRFNFDSTTIGTVLAVTAFFSAYSQLLSARLAARFGLVRTMVFTHLPANACLILAGIVPNGSVAIGFLLLRATVSAMDVPARQALVMAVVEPHERAAAASVTNVPRSLAAAATPLLAGLLLDKTTFGWPLIIGGAMKAAYDLLLLRESLDHNLK